MNSQWVISYPKKHLKANYAQHHTHRTVVRNYFGMDWPI